jgi:bifunctional UDP-N-acetylglucosamine pyrophosphorylase / glucosamine-1-phosphate N-acetyltransferase
VIADDPHNLRPTLAVVILAAGLGTRMRSRTAKESQPLLGRAMIDYVLDAAFGTGAGQIIVVLSDSKSALADRLPRHIEVAWQDEPLGTGHAAQCAVSLLGDAIDHVAVLFGDHPLLTVRSVDALVEAAMHSESLVTLLTTVLDEPGAYGRVRSSNDRIEAVVEARDDTETHGGPVEIYSGMSCYKRAFLQRELPLVPKSAGGEYYLTSLIERASALERPTLPVIAVQAEPDVAIGVNDRIELARAEKILRRRVSERLMHDGVAIVDPDTTYIEASVQIGMDSRIEPGVILRGETVIGEDCRIGPHSVIEDSRIGDRSEIIASHLEMAIVGARCHVGPFSHLRPGAVLADDVHVGNYAEIKNSAVGRSTHIGHFSYIGDAELGEDVNVGAGTVTCNFDGVAKHRTVIGKQAFIGSDTMLIAPVTIGDSARTGAGSVVTRDVANGDTVVGVPARKLPAQRDQASRNQKGT